MKKKINIANEPSEDFQERAETFEALRDEALFILSKNIKENEIKIHAIEHRIKTLDSIEKKISSGNYSGLSDLKDIVGLRVICLFKSDLMNIDSVIKSSFAVVDYKDTIESSQDSFGYMSVHYICVMNKEYSGPRYDAIRGEPFEIQVRTLCMHAWAAISHYLDYKAEWDIPDHLRKGLNALSGLFYVADSQYEQLYASRQEARSNVQEALPDDVAIQPINLDTVQSMLRRLFADRRPTEADRLSIFVKELQNNHYEKIGDVEKDILSQSQYLSSHDMKVKKAQAPNKEGWFFSDLGAARVSLKKSKPNYEVADFSVKS